MSHEPVTRLGLQLSNFNFPGVPDAEIFDQLVLVAKSAEAAGFDSLWTMDHLHQLKEAGHREDPILEAYTTLAALATVTDTAKLGVLVSAVGFRNPALLAKMVTTIDVISRGRAILGLGAGWHEEEYRAYGLPYPAARERLAQLSEAVQICRAMFTRIEPEFSGDHFYIDGPLNFPMPTSLRGPAILIGGGGERVTIPLVARFADACNFFGPPAVVRHKIEVLDAACAEIGRDPREVTRTWLGHGILADSETELQSALDRLGRLYGQSPRAASEFALWGDEAHITALRDEYLDAGLDGIILTLLDAGDPEYVTRLGSVLRTS